MDELGCSLFQTTRYNEFSINKQGKVALRYNLLISYDFCF